MDNSAYSDLLALIFFIFYVRQKVIQMLQRYNTVNMWNLVHHCLWEGFNSLV